ncbi:MAG: signal peptidase I [Desulfurococcaceae archaeon]
MSWLIYKLFFSRGFVFKLVSQVLVKVLPRAVLVAFTVLFLLTLLSRLGFPAPLGGVVVYSESMEPSIRRWDLALFVGVEPSVGDVVVYSLTPSFYVVHRYVGDHPYGSGIITKGDANPAPDPFVVSRKMLRGVVTHVVQREVWLPLLAYAVAVALIEVSRARIVGASSAMTYSTIIVFVLMVYGLTQPIPQTMQVELPVVHLSRVELNAETCILTVSYVGALQITDAELYVDGVRVEASINATQIKATIPRELAWRIGERGWTSVQVVAQLNHVGKLTGNYTIKVYPKPLSVAASNGSLIIKNPNGFPVAVNITFKYAYGVGERWRQTSTQIVVEGGESVLVDPPEGCRYAYAEVKYVLAGGERWAQVTVRY